MDDKKDLENGDTEMEYDRKKMDLPTFPKPLTLDEKKYLLAVERGDKSNVRRYLHKAYRKKDLNINCVDSLGRSALTLAIEGENMEMIELLIVMGVDTKDALLQAINAEFVEAVELLLDHEELIYKSGELYSWQRVDSNTSMFTPDITPLMLAAHKNNYEIIKILLDRGAALPDPHDIRCSCDQCIKDSTDDSLRHSMARLNQYRALASPSLIVLSSDDPILKAFQLSRELRNMAFAEQESKSEYLQLRHQTQKFAVELLAQSRSSKELAIILDHDPDASQLETGEHMKLARLELAIDYKQKKFVAHPNIQQLLASIWYEGVPGFRRKTALEKLMIISRVALLFPFYCIIYMIAPNCSTAKLMRKPFMKFLIHASSYLFFLLILIFVSQRAEIQAIQLFGSEWRVKELEKDLLKQRGNGPTFLELVVVVYVLGFIWEETQEIYVEGIRSYLRNLWNFIDFTRNTLYVAVALLRGLAYVQQTSEIRKNPQTAFIPREEWDAFDPQLIAEGLFAAANVFSALKLVHLFSINPHLGPLQISLGRMVNDIVKFFFIYSLVLFAFACGLNQLLWYFADLEKRKCYVLPGGLPDWNNAGDSCTKWRSFGNVFEASQSLFWASFGMVGLENFQLIGIKSYTRFWGLLMFGSYSVINVIVLLNLLIAMMSNSYAIIEEHSDVEWKFARSKLWMSYFEESVTLPPPFNIMPTSKLFLKMFGLRKKVMVGKAKEKEEQKKNDLDVRYTAVMRALVWRYVSTIHRRMDEEPVTEYDINELKGDVSSLRYELLEVFKKNGMDVSFTNRKEKSVLGKRMKVWERRLMNDFQVAPIPRVEEDNIPSSEDKPSSENGLSRFRRVAHMVMANKATDKWDQALAGSGISTQIGRGRKRDSFKTQQTLQRAMAEAKKLVQLSPLPGTSHTNTETSRCASPLDIPATPGESLLELIKDISTEIGVPVDISINPIPSSSSLGDRNREVSEVFEDLLSTEGLGSEAAVDSTKARTPSASQSKHLSISTSRGTSPLPNSKSTRSAPEPTEEDCLSQTTDPSPLVSKRIPRQKSPPKVFKKKPPTPSITGSEKQTTIASKLLVTKSPEIRAGSPEISDVNTHDVKLSEDIAVARPIVPEIKPVEGAIPRPPPVVKSKALPAPMMEVTPRTPSSNSRPASPVLSISSIEPPRNLPQSVPPRSSPFSNSSSLEQPSRTVARLSLTSTLNTEHLTPPVSPQTLRPVKKLDEVKTMKRQPKTELQIHE